MVLRRVASYAVPLGAALAAFLHAHAVGALIDGTTSPAAAVAPFAEARAAARTTAGEEVRWLDLGTDEALPVRAIFEALWGDERIFVSCSDTLCEARVLARPGARPL